MHTPIVTKQRSKLSFSPAQATFNRHRQKIGKLRNQIEFLKKDLDEAVIQYHAELLPINRKAADLITTYLFQLIDLTQEEKSLKKNQRGLLQTIMKKDVNTIFQLVPFNYINERIKKLQHEFDGVSAKDAFHEQMTLLQDQLRNEEGLEDLDFSDLDPNDDIRETMEKIAKAAQSARSKMADEPPPPPKMKTKKQILKEEKAKEFEAMQNKSLSVIYKQLAKELHPDLEQNPERRKEKEAVMKRLTAAYEENDLVTLLMLQSEWLDSEEGASDAINDDTFKIYNSLLKEQVEDLQCELDFLGMHPRYFEIHQYMNERTAKPLEAVKDAISDAYMFIEEYSKRLSDITGPNALKNLKLILGKEAGQSNYIEDMLFDLFMPEMSYGRR